MRFGRLTMPVILGLLLALLVSSIASAAAVVTSQTFSTTVSDTGLTDGCLPNATGTLAGTATFTILTVETATTFHVTGTEVDSGRVDWTNGDYTIIGSTDRFTFDAALQDATKTDAHSDFGDFYSADGVFLFREVFLSTEHFTITDGVTRVRFNDGHFLVFGSSCTPG